MDNNDLMMAEDKMENTIGNILRLGVILAASFVFWGGLTYLFKFGLARPDYVDFRGNPDSLNSLSGIVVQAFHLDSRGLIQFGLIVLIITPIARVMFSIISFFRQKDYLYSVVTLIVLTILLFGFFGG